MKKIILTLAILTFCLIASANSGGEVGAYSYEPDTDAVFSDHKNIADVVTITIGNKCIVGVRTKGVVARTQCAALLDALAENVKENFPQITEVHITTSVGEIIFLKNAKQQLGDEAEDTLTVYSEILARLDKNYICL